MGEESGNLGTLGMVSWAQGLEVLEEEEEAPGGILFLILLSWMLSIVSLHVVPINHHHQA